MKGIQINPNHAVAIYDNDTTASLQAWLYSPLDRLPPMQFFTAAQSAVDNWALIRVSDGNTVAQDPLLWFISDLTTGGRFHTYFGDLLTTPVPEGIYRARIELVNGDVYWSHALCCSPLFTPLTGSFGLTLDSCQQTNGYELDYTATGADYVEVYLGSIRQPDQGLAVKIKGPASPVEVRTYQIILVKDYEAQNGGIVSIRKPYTLTLTSDDACPTAVLTPGATVGGYGEELAFLEWWEDKDRQAQGIMYQDYLLRTESYRQRFYGKFWRAAPIPLVEEAFLIDANGNRVRQSATIGEALQLECWPIPDYAFTVLANAQNHQHITIENMDSGPRAVERFEFSSEQVGEDDKYKGIFSLTFNVAYVAGCQEDYEVE
jgi:hypothetical protein